MTPLREMVRRLARGAGRSRAALSVELYGYILLAQGAAILLLPRPIATLLHYPPVGSEALHFFQFAGLLASGVGFLYAVSGRLNAEGFVFATLLDRPLVPPIAAVLWWLGSLPGVFALLLSVQEVVTWLWTLRAWREKNKGRPP